MSSDPKITLTVYIGGALLFLCVITFMIVYNIRLKTRKRTEQVLGRPPLSEEEGIAVATRETERPNR